MIDLLTFIQSNSRYFQQMLNQSYPDDFTNVFCNLLKEGMLKRLQKSALTEAEENDLQFYLGGTARVLANWIRGGFREDIPSLASFLAEHAPKQWF